MTATLRLFRIEARRNAAIWFVPVIVLIAWWLLDTQSWTPFLWDSTNRLLQESVIPFAGPAIAGVAAWMAGRDQRRGMNDLLISTARPATQRRMTLWAATAAWGLVAYALFATYMMGQTATQATWGGPAFWPVAIVVLAILAHAAWGAFVGGVIRSRFTAPLVGVAALGLQQFAAQHSETFANGSSQSTWVNQFAAHNGHSDQHALFYLGLTGVALAAIALRERRNVIRSAALAVALVLAIGGGVMIWGEYSRNNMIVTVTNGTTHIQFDPVLRNNFGQAISMPDYNLPEPVCEGSPVTVCVHPAWEPVIDHAIADAVLLVEPLIGLPGVPMHVEQDYVSHGGPNYIDVSQFAVALVAEESTLEQGVIVNDAQLAMRSWLLQQADIGFDTWATGCYPGMEMSQGPTTWPGEPTPETCAATDRFADLDTAEQRTWFEQHYTDLRAGKLSLDDLP